MYSNYKKIFTATRFSVVLIFSFFLLFNEAVAQRRDNKLFNKKQYKPVSKSDLSCPDKPEKREWDEGKSKDPEEELVADEASIRRASRKIHFDIIQIKQDELEIPAFKQFKNNMTDFTAHGEEQFKEIISKIRDYLGDNTNGKGITLKIIGSASQIPTSYDPSKPNNNINPDGSSIVGQTSIENNRKLAQARALELAKKIKLVFSEIGIKTPSLSEIKLGETPWDEDAQKRLNDAVIRKDEAAKAKVFEPYQKEQFVKVESQSEYIKKIKPKTIEMHIVGVRPLLTYLEDGVEKEIIRFIVSKTLYEKVGGTLQFPSVVERDAYLEKENFKIIQNPKTATWYMYHSEEEKNAMLLEEDYDRIFQLFELGVVDEKDKNQLIEIITEKYLEGQKELVVEF